jgi:hypothetical protein
MAKTTQSSPPEREADFSSRYFLVVAPIPSIEAFICPVPVHLRGVIRQVITVDHSNRPLDRSGFPIHIIPLILSDI